MNSILAFGITLWYKIRYSGGYIVACHSEIDGEAIELLVNDHLIRFNVRYTSWKPDDDIYITLIHYRISFLLIIFVRL